MGIILYCDRCEQPKDIDTLSTVEIKFVGTGDSKKYEGGAW